MRSAHTIIIINKTNWKTEVETFDKWPLVLNMRFHWHRILFSLHLMTSASKIFIQINKKCVLSAVVLILCSHFEHAEANRTQKEKKIRFLEILELIKITSLFSWTVFVFLFLLLVSSCIDVFVHFFRFERESRFFLIHIGLINNGKKPLIFVLCLVFAVVLEILLCRFLFSFIGWFLFHYFYFHSSIVSPIQHFTRHTYSHTCLDERPFPCHGPWNFRKI